MVNFGFEEGLDNMRCVSVTSVSFLVVSGAVCGRIVSGFVTPGAIVSGTATQKHVASLGRGDRSLVMAAEVGLQLMCFNEKPFVSFMTAFVSFGAMSRFRMSAKRRPTFSGKVRGLLRRFSGS